jgi:heat shock protein HslJ
MRRVAATVIAIGLLFALAGCSSPSVASLEGTEWRVISIAGQAALPDRPPLITFKGEGASGFGFCSSYSLDGMAIDGTVSPARLSFTGASVQSSDCPEERDRLDRNYFSALEQASSIRLEGARLLVDGPGGLLVIERVAPASAVAV